MPSKLLKGEGSAVLPSFQMASATWSIYWIIFIFEKILRILSFGQKFRGKLIIRLQPREPICATVKISLLIVNFNDNGASMSKGHLNFIAPDNGFA